LRSSTPGYECAAGGSAVTAARLVGNQVTVHAPTGTADAAAGALVTAGFEAITINHSLLLDNTVTATSRTGEADGQGGGLSSIGILNCATRPSPRAPSPSTAQPAAPTAGASSTARHPTDPRSTWRSPPARSYTISSRPERDSKRWVEASTPAHPCDSPPPRSSATHLTNAPAADQALPPRWLRRCRHRPRDRQDVAATTPIRALPALPAAAVETV
jgi:hypothetical protein